MSRDEYTRIVALRQSWQPENWLSDGRGLCVADATTPVGQYTMAGAEDGGIHYQRCGGGRRVIRKILSSVN